MAYTLTNLQDDIRNYTEVDSSVLSTAVLNTIIKNAENRIYREVTLMIIDFMLHQIYNLETDTLQFHQILEQLDMFN